MNTPINKLLANLGVAIFVTCVGTSFAIAGPDGKSYPGLMCKDQYGPSSTRSPVSYSPLGGISNLSYTTVVRVNCLILKDDRRGRGGIDKVTVYYSDNHPTRKLDCKVDLRKADRKRDPVGRADEASPAGIHTGAFTLFGPTVKEAKFHFYYSMSCYLPPRTKARINSISTLHSYSVFEHEQEDLLLRP